MRPEDRIVWTDDLDHRLMRAIVNGDSYLTIARNLRTTRNAVAGRCYRLRKRGHVFEGPGHEHQTLMGNINRTYRPQKVAPPPPPKRKESVMSKPKTKTVAPVTEERVRDVSTGRLAPAKGNKVVRLEGAPEPVTILDLRSGQCKAAVGDEPAKGFGVVQPFVFCGAPVEEGSVYCETHGRFMYQRPKLRIPGDGGRGMVLERLGISKGA